MNVHRKSVVRLPLSLLIILALFVTPWLVIAPHTYLPSAVQTALDLLQRAITTLAPAPIPRLFQTFDALASITALKLLALGFLNPWLWAVILLPLVVAALVLFGSLIGVFLDSDGLHAAIDWLAVVGGGLAAIFLVVSLPQIEHLGLGGSYLARLALSLIGLQLSWGYWATLAGLLLLVGVGVYGLANRDASPRRPSPGAGCYQRPR